MIQATQSVATAWLPSWQFRATGNGVHAEAAQVLSSVADVVTSLALTTDRSDADLVRGVETRDQSDLKAIYDRFGGAVHSVALKVLRNPDLAEDVVQETFVTFWTSPEKFDPARGSLKTYLLTIAHRRAVDIVRSEEARTRRELVPPDPDYTSVEEEIMTRATSDRVQQALVDLDENERRAITMAYFGGLTYVEVADRLGAPEGTVKSRIRNGMRKLALNLEGVES
ncbi:MAG: sigma-70 family RNA polymerase sigma factor [Acidimicrobiia bacterium]